LECGSADLKKKIDFENYFWWFLNLKWWFFLSQFLIISWIKSKIKKMIIYIFNIVSKHNFQCFLKCYHLDFQELKIKTTFTISDIQYQNRDHWFLNFHSKETSYNKKIWQYMTTIELPTYWIKKKISNSTFGFFCFFDNFENELKQKN
jgi:hypothetical protein